MEYSTTQQRIAVIGRQPVLKKQVFVAALAIFGVFSAIAGLISIATATVLAPDAVTAGLADSTLFDAVYEFSLAALIFASVRAFSRSQFLSVWLYGASLVLDSFYNLLTGNPFNYLFIAFGLLLVWQIVHFRDRLELS